MKSKSTKVLYAAASLMFITGSSLMRQGLNSLHTAVVAAIPLLLGVAAFVIAVRRDDDAQGEQIDDYTFSTKHLKLLTISSMILAVGQILFTGFDENALLSIVSSVLIGAAFILMIFAMPKKHKAPLIFFLAFLVCLFIYLYFFEG
jgi:hypothetical protein